MKIMVTGSTGSIGAHLVKVLSEQGHTVHVLARSLEKAKNLNFKNIISFKGDITDKASIDAAIKGCQQVYHLAAFAKVWAKDTGTFYRINVEGTENILKSAVENKVEKVVVTSTAGIYGPSLTSIVNERKIREIDFFNEYEGSKTYAESRIKDYVNLYGLNVVIVSPTRVYGPFIFGEPSSTTLLINKFVNQGWRILPGTGKEIGNYAFMEDVVEGHILAMEKGKSGETYILGGENCSYNDFFKILRNVSGIKRNMIKVPIWIQIFIARFQLFMAIWFGKEPAITPKWIAKGKYNWEVSSDKAVQDLSYKITPLNEGLKKTMTYINSIR
ncbi:MAG: SDR family NAD(P)-dependent oxidoreductase [Prolixibacteraceae bacterium]|nr:SDR family NAD(P)-dependent oxidoreductase [Prolixibacteraceae bacterium]MBN2773322.1 SDR family NAD(P)-dependent oxidoreductase [Prolixibacteraceae bacterium]